MPAADSLMLMTNPVQLVSLTGALLQLAAYALHQLGHLDNTRYPYQLANVIGSLMMTVVASLHHDVGFILMEGVWCLTSAVTFRKHVAVWRLFRPPVGRVTHVPRLCHRLVH